MDYHKLGDFWVRALLYAINAKCIKITQCSSIHSFISAAYTNVFLWVTLPTVQFCFIYFYFWGDVRWNKWIDGSCDLNTKTQTNLVNYKIRIGDKDISKKKNVKFLGVRERSLFIGIPISFMMLTVTRGIPKAFKHVNELLYNIYVFLNKLCYVMLWPVFLVSE